MPVLTSIRQSPAYLYIKTYCLCAIITLFQATPISSQLPHIRDARLFKHRQFVRRPSPRTAARHVPDFISNIRTTSSKKPPPRHLLRRWAQRAVDLAEIKRQLRKDDKDTKTYPELEWDASVRYSSSLHPEEERFIQSRKTRISSQGINSLHQFLDLPKHEHVDPRDVPLIALGGSGGGYRAMYSFTAFVSASKKLGLWDCLTWTAGVSGSCWTIAAYYTIANHDVSRLVKHYLTVSRELAHPMSLFAFDTVVRSKKGVYFLLGPLVRKVRSGIIGLGIMDLYGTLITTYQLLSREPGARLSRATFQFSKVWTRSGFDKGLEPMPIFTAVRRAPKDASGVKAHTDSSLSKGRPPTRALEQHQTKVPSLIGSLHKQKTPETHHQVISPPKKGYFQWFEVTPLEIGSSSINKYIPTYSWGRIFSSGHSFGRPPEQSLALLLGQCTSAPAGPLTGYISALLASIPRGTMLSRLLLLLNDFVRMKKWERLWGNPIKAGHDPNPFYGHNGRVQVEEPSNNQPISTSIGTSSTKFSGNPKSKNDTPSKPQWEQEGRIRLMDSGMSNNLPNHVLARPERHADIIIAFDASSDVRTGSALQRIQNFADDCNIEIEDVTLTFTSPKPRFGDGEEGRDIEGKFLNFYVKVFKGTREGGEELYLVYCPLLPNGGNPGFDPSTASFFNSYNLVWTSEQIQLLLDTSSNNVSWYSMDVIRDVVLRVYFAKKKKRLFCGGGAR